MERLPIEIIKTYTPEALSAIGGYLLRLNDVHPDQMTLQEEIERAKKELEPPPLEDWELICWL